MSVFFINLGQEYDNVKMVDSEDEAKHHLENQVKVKESDDYQETTEDKDELTKKEWYRESEKSEKEIELMHKKFCSWPLQEIKEPHENDVLYGRGGGTNRHPGNKRYRSIVNDKKADYVIARPLDKPLVALDIIRVLRAQEPPGRFLKKNEKTSLWEDVGDNKARIKILHALRWNLYTKTQA